jgi:hypothetical protein
VGIITAIFSRLHFYSMTEITYDVFISHAFEDKNDFVDELAFALKEKGLKVYYSGFELKIGDSITDSVNNALKTSKYGIVIISPIYLEKHWAMQEFNALFAQEAERNRILPILHHISVEEVKKHLPIFVDRYAISSDKGIKFISDKVIETITGKKTGANDTMKKNRSREDEDDDFITLGGPVKRNAGKNSDTVVKNKNINKNTNNVTVNTGSSAAVPIIIIIIILIAGFFIWRNFSSPETNTPAVIKNNGPLIQGQKQ